MVRVGTAVMGMLAGVGGIALFLAAGGSAAPPLVHECVGGIAGIPPGRMWTRLYPDRVVTPRGEQPVAPGVSLAYWAIRDLLRSEAAPACRGGRPVPDDMVCSLRGPDGSRQVASVRCPPGRALRLWNRILSGPDIDAKRLTPLVRHAWSPTPDACRTERRWFQAEGTSLTRGWVTFQVLRQGRWQAVDRRRWFRVRRVLLINADPGPGPYEVLVLSVRSRPDSLRMRVVYPLARADQVLAACAPSRPGRDPSG